MPRRLVLLGPLLSFAMLASSCRHSAPPVAAPSRAPSPSPSPTLPPAPSPSPSAAPTPPPLGKPAHWITGPLHTFGTQIVDAGNHPVRLTGIGIIGMQHGTGSPYPDPQPFAGCIGWRAPDSIVYGQVRSWGFNVVRLPVTWANLEPSPPTKGKKGKLEHHWNSAYLGTVDALIHGFARKGVATILDMSQVRWSPAFTGVPLPNGHKLCGDGMPDWLYPGSHGIDSIASAEKDFFADRGRVQQKFLAAWTFLANHVRKQKMVVGADILNEPYDILVQKYPGGTDLKAKDLDLRGFYEKAGRAIHDANPNLLLIFQDNKSRRTGKWCVTGPPDLPNAVYSAHWYSTQWSSSEGKPKLKGYVKRARGWDMPLWLGEFTAMGYSTNDVTGPHWETDTKTFLAYAEDNDVGWTVWAYGSGDFLVKGTTDPKPGIVKVLRTGF